MEFYQGLFKLKYNTDKCTGLDNENFGFFLFLIVDSLTQRGEKH